MRVKVVLTAGVNERYGPRAFEHNVGRPITVNVTAGGKVTPTQGTLAAARIIHGGRQAELTIDLTPSGQACRPLPLSVVSDRVLDELEPAPRAMMEHLNSTGPLFLRDDFTRIGETLTAMLVCTSMTDGEVNAHAALLPSGTTDGWRLREVQPTPPAGPCPNRPTHRHVVLGVWTG